MHSLKNCTLRLTLDVQNSDPDALPFTLPHLSNLHVQLDGGDDPTQLFELATVTFPSLQTLALETRSPGWTLEPAGIKAFLERSAPPLRELQIGAFDIGSVRLFSTLDITSLKLVNLSVGFTKDFFRALSLDTKFSPRLRELSCKITRNLWDDLRTTNLNDRDEVLMLLVDIVGAALVARRQLVVDVEGDEEPIQLLESFQLTLQTFPVSSLRLSEVQLATLRRLKEDGMQISFQQLEPEWWLPVEGCDAMVLV